ncbi:MAG: hypothetical protein K0S78_1026 [Thermomicrobiales bacterium]|jgi:hypothetical protein|nr:hypothetical protein [Thermomicrobiales bacterium]MDF3038694.1 hypothetical protein [Thermomicrobiales bacterium]
MEEGFARALDAWTGYFALMGGAAATLLGLLFVAVSLRLNIFHEREVADVRDYAALTLGTYLAALAVAGAALAPHEHRIFLVLALLAIGVTGLLVLTRILRITFALNRELSGLGAPAPSHQWRGWPYALLAAGPYVALLAGAFLLWRQHPDALGWVAVSEGWLLAAGTVSTWILLSHAGNVSDQGSASSQPPQS